MLGAIVGDIVGSRFEWKNIKHKFFELFTPQCMVTDDSIMTLAIAKAIMDSRADWEDLSQMAIRAMREVGRPYPGCGYGSSFLSWMYSDDPQPYNSFGNGAAMRVSACGFAAHTLEEAKRMSEAVTRVTHNHPEGLKGAEATTVAIYLARTGSTREEIRQVIDREYYPMNFTLDGIRDSYLFNETCLGTIPHALMAFFESVNFEDAIRNAVSIGGDSDTLAAITGSIAEAFYGVPKDLEKKAVAYLDQRQKEILSCFQKWLKKDGR